jgi:hypothetical protein
MVKQQALAQDGKAALQADCGILQDRGFDNIDC